MTNKSIIVSIVLALLSILILINFGVQISLLARVKALENDLDNIQAQELPLVTVEVTPVSNIDADVDLEAIQIANLEAAVLNVKFPLYQLSDFAQSGTTSVLIENGEYVRTVTMYTDMNREVQLSQGYYLGLGGECTSQYTTMQIMEWSVCAYERDNTYAYTINSGYAYMDEEEPAYSIYVNSPSEITRNEIETIVSKVRKLSN